MTKLPRDVRRADEMRQTDPPILKLLSEFTVDGNEASNAVVVGRKTPYIFKQPINVRNPFDTE